MLTILEVDSSCSLDSEKEVANLNRNYIEVKVKIESALRHLGLLTNIEVINVTLIYLPATMTFFEYLEKQREDNAS